MASHTFCEDGCCEEELPGVAAYQQCVVDMAGDDPEISPTEVAAGIPKGATAASAGKIAPASGTPASFEETDNDQHSLIVRMQHAIQAPLTAEDIPQGTGTEYMWRGSSADFSTGAEQVMARVTYNATRDVYDTAELMGPPEPRPAATKIRAHLLHEGLASPLKELQVALNKLHAQRKDIEGKILYAQAAIDLRQVGVQAAMEFRNRLLNKKQPCTREEAAQTSLAVVQAHFDNQMAKFIAPLLTQRAGVLAEIAGFELVMDTFSELRPLRLVAKIIDTAVAGGALNTAPSAESA